MRRLAVPALLAMAIACGSPAPTAGPGPTGSGSGSASPAETVTASPALTSTPPTSTTTPTPRPTQTPAGTLTLTEADAGRTFVLQVGQEIKVELGRDYYAPTASNSVLARTEAGGGYPTGQPATATFRAMRAGESDLTSSTDYACLHTVPACGIPQQLWSVRIIVN